MSYSKIEQQMRKGDYKEAKKLSADERIAMIDHVSFQGSPMRAVEVAKVFATNFKYQIK